MMKKTRLASRSSVIRFSSKVFPDAAGRNRGSGECATVHNALAAAFGVKPLGSQPPPLASSLRRAHPLTHHFDPPWNEREHQGDHPGHLIFVGASGTASRSIAAFR